MLPCLQSLSLSLLLVHILHTYLTNYALAMEKCVVCLLLFFPITKTLLSYPTNVLLQLEHRHYLQYFRMRDWKKATYNWCSLLSSLNRYLNLIKMFHAHFYLHASVCILIQSNFFPRKAAHFSRCSPFHSDQLNSIGYKIATENEV